MMSTDLRNMYFQVPILESSRKFFRLLFSRESGVPIQDSWLCFLQPQDMIPTLRN